MWEKFLDLFTNTDFSKINELFTVEYLLQAIKNPYFVAVVVIVFGLLIYLKKFKVIALIISISSFMVLVNYCLPHGNLESTGGESLATFIIGSIIIGAFFIYMFFIRSD